MSELYVHGYLKGREDERSMRPFEVCPDCDQYYRVSLPLDWALEFEYQPNSSLVTGPSLPIIGCGNPWHYLVWDVETHNGVTRYHALDES